MTVRYAQSAANTAASSSPFFGLPFVERKPFCRRPFGLLTEFSLARKARIFVRFATKKRENSQSLYWFNALTIAAIPARPTLLERPTPQTWRPSSIVS